MTKSDFNKHLTKIFNKEKGLSYSALSNILKSPSHYYRYVTDKEKTEAMKKGQRFHMAILEPEEFKKKYFIIDDSEKIEEIGGKSPRSTKHYKEWKNSVILENEGRELVDKKEVEIYNRMIDKLKCHSVAGSLLFDSEGENEKPFTYDDSDFLITGKIDRATKEYTVDLKKVADASWHKIRWDIERMNYDLQGVIYSKANKTKKHYLVYIDEACNITVILMQEDKLISYSAKYYAAFNSFKECAEQDLWHMSYDYYQKMIIL